MNYIKLVVAILLFGMSQNVDAQWYKYYHFIGDDAEQMAPIWGWNLSIDFPFPLGKGLGKKMEENKWSHAFMATPMVNWENIYMYDQLTIGKEAGITKYYSDDSPERTYESKFLSYQSRHRFIKTGAQFFYLLNYNEFLISFEIQPNYMIGGNVKHRFTEDDKRTTSNIRYKDDPDYFNLRRFNILSDLRIQYSYFVVSAGLELLPMFRDEKGPNIQKTFFSIGATLPPSMLYDRKKAVEKFEKMEFEM